MRNSALPSEKPADLTTAQIKRFADGWLLSCEIRPCSPATMKNRRLYVRNLLWFLHQREFEHCGVTELRAFFAYFNTAHKDTAGRWGNPQERTPVKPSTIATYHRAITAMFNWFVSEDLLSVSPMARIPAPIDRADAIEPFTEAQVNALIAAAKKARQPRRDEALVWFLLDTGVRASELCGLLHRHVDLTAKRAQIIDGKGGKSRPVYFGKVTAKALWAYTNGENREDDEPVFMSERGEPLTRSGLRAAIIRLGNAAKITQARCTPHTFRHTMSVAFLRAGGSQFVLMNLLGHEDMKMTARYVRLAAADVESQARQFSPADKMKKR